MSDQSSNQFAKNNKHWVKNISLVGIFKWLVGLFLAGALLLFLFLAVMFASAVNNVPPIDGLRDYKPKMPMRIYSADNFLLGEFSEERREFIPIEKMPKIMQHAIVAIEDERFYNHNGVDFTGIVRAAVTNIFKRHHQGASTITMQLARNFFLSKERTLKRKIYEIVLAYRIEKNFSKDKILELYMNQIFLGQNSYGFGAAARTYFGKSMDDISIAEAAMLAGLPKAPSAYNPVINPKRAKIRQEYILKRLLEQAYITPEQYKKALAEELVVRSTKNTAYEVQGAEYVAEQVRNMLFKMPLADGSTLGSKLYSTGFSIYTTVLRAEQEAAYKALQKAIKDYDRRQGYRGPEAFIDLPSDPTEREEAIDDALSEHPDINNYLSAVVLGSNSRYIKAIRQNGDVIEVTGSGLNLVKPMLSSNAASKVRIREGAIIRLNNNGSSWSVVQLPEVQGAFIALNTKDGAIRAMTGGFDFKQNKFNHAVQANRQPGSTFKPFIYSAAFEKGFSPMTVVNDAPLSLPSGERGNEPWTPKNYDGKFEGPMTLKRALAKSKNLVSIRILRTITPKFAQQFIQNFGFPAEKHEPYLPMALGTGSVTPLEMAVGYSLFANGGYRIEPYLIKKIVDNSGKVIHITKPTQAGDGSIRTIDERNAFLTDSLLKEVVNSGTAVAAKDTLKRKDIAGKTGTTNNAYDAWFAGYASDIVGVAWMGFDNPKSLGARETGGGLALPIWINYMKTALDGREEKTREVPAGLTQINGDWIYSEYAENNTSIRFVDQEAIKGTPSGSQNYSGGGGHSRLDRDNTDVLDTNMPTRDDGKSRQESSQSQLQPQSQQQSAPPEELNNIEQNFLANERL